jgi:iron-sulfur cluster repair protein YtfE (RIC family)
VTATAIPESIRIEHRAIHEQLEEAMQASGQVGVAARTLGKVLHPHFVREEEIALPPLGALTQLAAGTLPFDATALLKMTDALKRELPQMLAEHTHIRAAVRALSEAARAERAATYERLAEQLALHAQTEEEVLYPAAVLVGELIRSRLAAQ